MENVPILLIAIAPPSTSTPSSTTTSTAPSTTVSPSPSPSSPPSFFHIHSNLLLPFSPPFTRLFDALPTPPPGQWKALTISDIPPPIFASFVQWLYYGDKHFAALESAAESAALAPTSDVPSFALALAQLYIVAERYDVTELRDAVVGEVARHWSETHAPPPSGLVDYVYANTVASSVMRRLVVEWHGVRGDEWFGSEEAKEVLERVPQFAGELALALGVWHTRGGERLLIERDEGGSGEESLEEEDEGNEISEEGSTDLKSEMRGVLEGNETGVGSEASEETLPG